MPLNNNLQFLQQLKHVVIQILFLFVSKIGYAQISSPQNDTLSNTKVQIAEIIVTGNKRTKFYIIERELPFKKGDSLNNEKLPEIFKQARNQVYNTNLFIEVKLDSIALTNNTLQVNVKVKERFYIFPVPRFSLIDRNFKEWYKTFNADLNRVVYGISFKHYNFSGRRDRVDVTFLNGYARNVSVNYNNPYSNRALNRGFSFGAGFTQNREVAYITSKNHIIQPFKKTGFVRNAFNIGGSYSIRNGFFKTIGFGASFNYSKVDDSILTVKYNPNYFDSKKSSQNIFDFGFAVNYANTDKNAYPLKGLKYSYGISKRGIGFSSGLDNVVLSGGVTKYFTHKRNFYSAIKVSGLLKLPFEQAYVNQRALGLGDFKLRGLELYLIDGVAASVANYTFSKKLVAFKINVPFNIKALPYVPFTLYPKVYSDFGFSYLPSAYKGNLNNRFLYTSGIGLDILSVYDLVLKVEYSFNQLGQNGLFLRTSTSF
jgi:outer membrane protein assembly factor BamA